MRGMCLGLFDYLIPMANYSLTPSHLPGRTCHMTSNTPNAGNKDRDTKFQYSKTSQTQCKCMLYQCGNRYKNSKAKEEACLVPHLLFAFEYQLSVTP